MSNKIKLLHTAGSILVSVAAVVCALALIISCVQIYRGGDRPFTPESISAAWNSIAIFVWLFVALVIACGVLLWLFPLPAKKSKATASPHARLAKVRQRLARKQYADELLAPLVRHDHYLKTMRASAVIVCTLSAIYPLFYLSDPSNFTSINTQLNAQIIRAVLPALGCALIALFFCGAIRLLSDISAERAVAYAKAIMLLPAPAALTKPVGKQSHAIPKYAMFVCQVVLIVAAIIMIVIGVLNGGMNDVLQKAIKICTECIGLG